MVWSATLQRSPFLASAVTSVTRGNNPLSLDSRSLCKDRPKRPTMPISNRNSGPRSSTETGQHTGLHPGGKSETAVFSTDRQGNFLACNQAFTRFLGHESAELVGLKFTAIFSGEELGASKDAGKQPDATILALVSGQGHYQADLHAKAKSGEIF